MLDRLLFPQVSDLHLDFRMQNARHGLVLTDDLQVHLLELPKYNSDAQSVVQATPLEKWAYFFRNAAQLTPSEIAARLTDAAFVQAAGVLEMIARTPRENELYNARLKMERDEAARLEFAKDEGRVEGRVEGLNRGTFVGRIQASCNNC